MVLVQPDPLSLIVPTHVPLFKLPGCPPFVALMTSPSPQQTATLCSLSADQRPPFYTMCRTLRGLGKKDPHERNLLMALVGEPGSGKSHVISAFLWHVFQHNMCEQVRCGSFTWRAALHLWTPFVPAVSTHRLFGLPVVDKKGVVKNKAKTYAMETTRMNVDAPVQMLIIDEFSFLSQEHE